MRSPSEPLVTRLTMEIAVALFTATIGAIAVFGSVGDGIGWDVAGPQAGYFPFYIGLIVIAASLGALIQAVIKHRDPIVMVLGNSEHKPWLDSDMLVQAL